MADTQLPLLGVILCCTSIPPEKRSELAAIASQMGAVHKLDLTSDVTHLVVGDTDTPKYKFVAKERPDVKCVLDSWIDAVRASWLEGGETNVEELERVHKLPTFIGLRLCVTGFDDLIYRKALEDAINENGGDYRGNLTKDVTHLVAKEPAGAKYDYAGQWGIRTVGVEWLEHSLERGMILDESLYHLSIPPEERGRNAWMRRSESVASLGKRTRPEEVVPQNARKLRRTASARLSSQNVGLWSELVGVPVEAEERKAGVWDEQPEEAMNQKVAAPAPRSEDMKFAPTAESTQRTLKKSLSEANLGNILGRSFSSEGLFHGKSVSLHDFDEKKAAIIQEHLRSHGAEIINDVSQPPNAAGFRGLKKRLLLIPHTMLASDAPLDPEPMNQWTVVTDLWVERCIYKKKLEDPRVHTTSTPFSRFPIPGFEDLAICSTGFQGIDLLHTSKAVKLMGGTYVEYFTPKSSVLVCNTVVPGHEKLAHAQLWSIPAVRASWLWDSIRKGELMPIRPYLVQEIKDPNKPGDSSTELEKADLSAKARNNDGNQRETKRPDERTMGTTNPEVQSEHVSRPSSQLMLQRESSSGFTTKPSTSPKTKSSQEEAPKESAIYLDDDTPILPHSVPENSSNTLSAPSACAPLKEITPNSSPPKRSASPTKTISPAKVKDLPSASEDSSLGPAISSLLAHHQRSKSDKNENPPPLNSSDPSNPYRRRRRQLFGRAPSNLSSHSINLSRASSVDTMNTDGLGTPLEPSNSTRNTINPEIHNNNNNNNNMRNKPNVDFAVNIYTASHHHDDDPDRINDEALQMTQLGYEDPDVAAWRERVAIKMSGGKVKEGKAGTPGRKGGSDLKRETSSLGIAKRTRLATSK